ncbi:MAG: leucine-rich repeat domain-containing protein [Treponema sp.]|nr:leucine-rich repeat domain-containing protein [Treponema sp.]
MKIKFTKLPTNDGIIKVSLDGGNSFKDYNVADVHKSGISLSDNQDYEKIQIKAPANILKNLNVVSSVKVENTEGGGAGSTNESSFIMDTDTYGFEFPICVTGIIIPNGATTIGKNVFSTYPNLYTVVIPESVTSIGDYAFLKCSSLTSVTIPDSVTSISEGAFCACSSLTSITIPESVTSISGYAFQNCTSLTSVTIPEGVTSIGVGAFDNCSSLTSITIPEGVTSIGNYAFEGCSGLKTINYTGTKEQWNAIRKYYHWNYETSFNVIYNYKPE